MDQPGPIPRTPEAGGLRDRLAIPVLAFGGILMAVMQTVVVPLLPDLPRLTNSSPGAVSWMVTATLLSGAVLTPVLGRAGDMYGKRRVLTAALVLMTAGSVMCALSSDIVVLITARALQGAAAAAAVVPLSISILRDELPPERRGSAVALMSSTVGIGAALGLPLAALVVQYADWHTMFWLTSGLGALGVTAVWWVVKESPVREPGRFDVVGALALAAGLVCLLLGVSQGGQWGWGARGSWDCSPPPASSWRCGGGSNCAPNGRWSTCGWSHGPASACPTWRHCSPGSPSTPTPW